jgi:predicted MFS family arabinose efflux permease
MHEAVKKNPMDAGTVIVAALIASAIGALFYNVLPLFLGSAQDYRGLDNRAIGFLSSAFFLGYNVVTVSAFFWIRRLSWALVIAVATPLAALALYAGTLTESYAALLMSVAIAGGAFAAIYGVGTTILGDTSNPGRWYGIKIAAEALTGAVLLLVLPSTAIARWGFEGTVFGLIIVMVFMSPFLFWTPTQGIKSPGSDVLPIDVPEPAASGQPAQTPFIWGAIAATLIFFAGASAIWAFIERIGAQVGHDPSAVGVLLAVTLVFAVIGSLVAAVLGGRFGTVKPFVAGAGIFLAALVALGQSQSFSLYAAGACAVTFAIGFMLPIAVTEIAELDTDGRYVVLSVPAIGVGAMTGPAVAGLLTQSGSFAPMLIFGAATIVIASFLIATAAAHARPGVAVTREPGT